ncbi:type I modular polyketide synthase [Anopheles sinensis]|uniref:Type I modular polyketide synthase n=1 Tax=Anopheles sinensis TaxID=74873 RepID=A0A084VAF4_ANOSI|nr:type I modular polyketide synthase [Anopheles sinensis]
MKSSVDITYGKRLVSVTSPHLPLEYLMFNVVPAGVEWNGGSACRGRREDECETDGQTINLTFDTFSLACT